MVPLGDAWQTVAQLLTDERRTELANDPLGLLAVDGRTNEAKGDGDAATWLPPTRPTGARTPPGRRPVTARSGVQ